MAQGDVVVRFDEVSFEYGHNKPILDEVDFSVRRGSKITIMGQNGAGKSTIFQLITKDKRVKGVSIYREFPSCLRIEIEPHTRRTRG